MDGRGNGPSIGAALRELRRAAGLTGAAMARRAGWSQPKVSRIETGTVLPSERDLRTWIDLTGGASDQFDELWCLCVRTRERRAPTLVHEPAGAHARSWADRYEAHVHGDLERGGFRAYHPGQIEPILMTGAFLREALEASPETIVDADDGGHADPVETVGNLRIMHQDMLYSPDAAVQVVLGEAALYYRPVGVRTMLAQLDRLRDLLLLPGLDLRVLTFRDTHPSPSPFVLYDDRVLLPYLIGDVWITDIREVGVYTTLMDELSDRAQTGDDVRATLERARSWHAAESV